MTRVLLIFTIVFVLASLTFLGWILWKICFEYSLKSYEFLDSTLENETKQVYLNKDVNPIMLAKRSGISSIPLYYINLYRSPDRKKLFEKVLAKHGLKATRIDAIDGKKRQGATFMDGISFKCDYTRMKDCEIACCLSHLRAIKRAYDDGNQYAIVFEDDVSFQFLPHWPIGILTKLIKTMPKDTGILQLAWFGGNGHCVYKNEYTHVALKPKTYCYSGCAYLVTRKGMADVLRAAIVTDHFIHIRKQPYITEGVADVYIYQATNVLTTGLPLFMPQMDIAMNTTIQSRPGNHMAYQLNHFNRVASKYVENLNPKHRRKQSAKFPYRLADAILGKWRPIYDRNYHMRLYPNSIVGQYFKKTKQFGDMNILLDVILSNKHKIADEINPNITVIHLRLGDVLNKSKYTVDEHLASPKGTPVKGGSIIYVKPLSYFTDHLKHTTKSRKLEFVFGSHIPNTDSTKSYEYISKLREALELKGYTCTLRTSHMESDPDMDFLYLCFAPNLITTGGGYSDLAKKINDHIYKK